MGKNGRIRDSVSDEGGLPRAGKKEVVISPETQTGTGPLETEEKVNGRLLSSMLEAYIRGSEEGQSRPRAAQLVEKVVDLALYAEDQALRLSAIKFIYERVDGKPVERKEIKSMKIQGIIYIPEAVDIANV
jgi:hypothetical protein